MSKHFNTTDSESKKKTICVPAFSFALVFSTAYVVGYSFNKDLSFSWCTQNSVLAAALLLILMILAYHLCKMLFKASAPFSKSDGSKQIARQLNARRSLLLFALLFYYGVPSYSHSFQGQSPTMRCTSCICTYPKTIGTTTILRYQLPFLGCFSN